MRKDTQPLDQSRPELDAFAALDAISSQPSQLTSFPVGAFPPDFPEGEKSGQISPFRIPRTLADLIGTGRYTPEFRAAIAAAALPLLAEGASVRTVAEAAQVSEPTLRAWCIQHDEEAYRTALSAQLAARFAHFGQEIDAAAADAAQAVRLVHEGATLDTSTSESDKGSSITRVLMGVELSRVALARARIAESAGKYYGFIGERRLSRQYARPDGAPPPPASAAQFTFIINGQTSHPAGLTIEAQASASPVPIETTEEEQGTRGTGLTLPADPPVRRDGR